jgi:hypothetical protein
VKISGARVDDPFRTDKQHLSVPFWASEAQLNRTAQNLVAVALNQQAMDFFIDTNCRPRNLSLGLPLIASMTHRRAGRPPKRLGLLRAPTTSPPEMPALRSHRGSAVWAS